MSLAELVLISLLTTQPFGNLPIAVSPVDEHMVHVEILGTPRVSFFMNDQMEILDKEGTVTECQKENNSQT